MSSITKNWRDGPVVTGDLFNHIVKQRELANLGTFLNPEWPKSLHDPGTLPNINAAVERLWRAVVASKIVGIMGDYDMDGTPGAALLAGFLQRLGVQTEVILPTRDDGYGFSPEKVERFVANGVKLIVTVDCGIRDFAAIDAARGKGIDVIITDHHEPEIIDGRENLPQALAIVNPKLADSKYPFRELCGTAVVFKLITAMASAAPVHFRAKLPDGLLAWSLDLVAMATLGDMVPLTDENRVMVQFGLKVLRKGRRPGLMRFIESLGLKVDELSYEDIVFKIVPKLNASGRVADMDDVFTILTSANSAHLDSAIQRVMTRAVRSQLWLKETVTVAQAMAAEQADKPVIVVADLTWQPGLTGLVATRLSQEFARPVAVLAGTKDGQFRGSMRGGDDLPVLLASIGEHIERFGGHQFAAGLSIKFEKLNQFIEAIQATRPSFNSPKVVTDGLITTTHLSLPSLEALSRLAPWGTDNAEPIWSLKAVDLKDMAWMGADQNHLRGLLGQNDSTAPFILFSARQFEALLTSPVDLWGQATINVFRGTRSPQFVIKGIAKAK